MIFAKLLKLNRFCNCKIDDAYIAENLIFSRTSGKDCAAPSRSDHVLISC
jgi:hypothetical protein